MPAATEGWTTRGVEAGENAGKAEIHNHGAWRIAGEDDDIGEFEVAVDDTLAMRGMQTISELSDQIGRCFLGECWVGDPVR